MCEIVSHSEGVQPQGRIFRWQQYHEPAIQNVFKVMPEFNEI